MITKQSKFYWISEVSIHIKNPVVSIEDLRYNLILFAQNSVVILMFVPEF